MENYRVNKIDYIKAISIFLVIYIHVIQYVGNRQHINSNFYFTSISLGRTAVPMLFLVTGYLFLGEKLNNQDYLPYLKKYVLPLSIKSLLGIVFFLVFNYFYYDYRISLISAIKQLLFLEQIFGVFTWYIPVILLIYWLLPLINIIFQSLTNKELLVLLMPIFLYVFALNDFNVWLQTIQKSEIYSQFLFTDISVYITYILVGGLLKKTIKVSRKITVLSIFLSMISLFSLVYLQLKAVELGGFFDPWYNSGLVFLFSSSLFALLFQIKLFERKIRVIEFISNSTFELYLIHLYYIDIFGKLFFETNLKDSLRGENVIFILYLIAVVLSCVSTAILKKIFMFFRMKVGKIEKI